MNDNIPSDPTPKIEDSIIPKPKPTGDWKGLRGVLEGLPQEVKDDMEDYMRKVNPHASRKYMIEKYGETFPKLKEMSKLAFNQYFKRHKVKIAKELALQKQSAVTDPEVLGIINAITDPNIGLDDKRTALTALYNACKARSEILELRQTNFIDPQTEALILANRKEMRTIIERVATLSEQLSKDADKDWLSELSDFTQVLLSSVTNTYKLTHKDQTNFSLFSSTLSENFTQTLKSYRAAKERLKSSSK